MRTVALTLVMLAFVAASVVPALAQDEENVKAPDPSPTVAAPARDDNTLYSGPYAVTEDGALIHGGDSVYQCKDLVTLGAPAKPGSEGPNVNGYPLEPLTREAIDLCTKAGFPPVGAILGASASPNTLETGDLDTLPATGGLALSALVMGAAVLAAVTLVARSLRK